MGQVGADAQKAGEMPRKKPPPLAPHPISGTAGPTMGCSNPVHQARPLPKPRPSLSPSPGPATLGLPEPAALSSSRSLAREPPKLQPQGPPTRSRAGPAVWFTSLPSDLSPTTGAKPGP